ncbi:MAG: hypothetical protein QOJ64_2074 [Acidobacteriota bacterium]|jgi:hypothetical protein|nr:hypothetical protein [Acidobacteriota bacterium]
MLKHFASLLLIAALVCALVEHSAFAQTPSTTEARLNQTSDLADSGYTGKSEVQFSGSLKGDISKLVADAKAGTRFTVSDPQNQPAQSNSLSKKTKIAIGVSVAAAIIIAILYVHARNHLFDDF